MNATGLNAGESSVETFHIDGSSETLIPVAGSFLELVSTPIGAASNPLQGKFYVFLGPNVSSSNPAYQQDGDLLVYTIDPDTGLLGDETGSAGSTDHGRAFGADSVGRFVVTAQGQTNITLKVTSAEGAEGIVSLGPGIFPQDIFVGPGQHFVYVTAFAGPNSVVRIFIVNPNTWELSEAPSSPLPGFTSVGTLIADPTGPYVYQSTAPNQVRVYSVDVSTGYLTAIGDSPFTAPGFGLPAAFSVNAANLQPEVGPVATLTPPNMVLGTVPVGTAAPAQTLMLTSTGDQALAVNGIAIGGLNASEFSEADTCEIPTVLPPTHSCFISVVFTPAAAGGREAQISITDNGGGSPQVVNLSGAGAGGPPPAPGISFSATALNFPALTQGTTSAPMTITVTNSGNAVLNISSIVLGGSSPADFSNPLSNCIGAPVLPGASCTVTETFTPLGSGLRQATLTFSDNAAGTPHMVSLMGTGNGSPSSGPSAKITPTVVNFPVTTQGLASVPINVNINNAGNGPLHISGITAGGAGPADFTNNFGACITATVAANASCTVSVAFAPLSSGSQMETLSVADDAPNSPQSINILANAVPAFTATSPASALSVSVAAGQTATYNLQFTPGLDFNGTIALTYSGAPLAATCKAPSSVVINTNAAASFTVTVTTSGKATAPAVALRMPRHPSLPTIWFELLAGVICVFVQRMLKLRERARHLKLFYATVSLLILTPLILAANGCTGSVGSTPAPQGNSVFTPSGTSILVLTPTASNATGKALQVPPIQLTLIVN